MTDAENIRTKEKERTQIKVANKKKKVMKLKEVMSGRTLKGLKGTAV